MTTLYRASLTAMVLLLTSGCDTTNTVEPDPDLLDGEVAIMEIAAPAENSIISRAEPLTVEGTVLVQPGFTVSAFNMIFFNTANPRIIEKASLPLPTRRSESTYQHEYVFEQATEIPDFFVEGDYTVQLKVTMIPTGGEGTYTLNDSARIKVTEE